MLTHWWGIHLVPIPLVEGIEGERLLRVLFGVLGRRFFCGVLTRFDQFGGPAKSAVCLVRLDTQSGIRLTEQTIRWGML